MALSTSSRSFCRCLHALNARHSSSDASARAPSNLVRSAVTPKVFSSSEDLADHLIKNHIFHKPGHFLILNKPYGVSTYGYAQSSGGIFETSRYDQKESSKVGVDAEDRPSVPTIESALPHLRYKFREPWMQMSTGLKRYLSGPIVIPCSPQDAAFMKESIKFASAFSDNENHDFSQHRALAICVGRPKQSNEVVRGFSTFQTVGDKSEYVFVEGNAKRRAKSGKFAVSGSVEYNVLYTKHGCSLVDLKFGKFNRHLPRLVMSHVMAPILGDRIYQNRLATVDGELHTVEPKFTRRNKHRLYVPSELLECLDMTVPEYMSKIPMFFHVYQTVFPRYGNAKDRQIPDLIAMSQPPENFTTMLRILGLSEAAAKHFRSLSAEDQIDDVEAVTSKEKTF